MQGVVDVIGDLADNMLMTRGDLLDVLFSLGLAVVIAVIISQMYKYTHRGMSFELSFMSTLVLLPPIVAVVMLFIRGDLVLSLGLIGSLSIIRFRTPIKDTRDMVFLFWAIAVGLGCGTYNWMIVILSTMFMIPIMFALHFLRYGNSRNADFVLVISGTAPYRGERVQQLVSKRVKDAQVRSFETEEGHWEIIYEVRFPRMSTQEARALIEELEALDGVRKVSLLGPQLALPV